MIWTWVHDLGLLSADRSPLTLHSFVTDALPSLVLYYLYAYMALTPGTRPLKVALLPVSLWSFLKTSMRIDLSCHFERSEGFAYLNLSLALAMIVFAIRCLSWTFQPVPFQRKLLGFEDENKNRATSAQEQFKDAFDLVFNLRGYGWNWSDRLHVPAPKRPTHSRPAFLLSTFLALIKHAVIADHFHWVIQWFIPGTINGSIYDPSLPPVQDVLRATFITFLSGFLAWASMEAAYDLFALVGVGIFQQHPLQWPPLFDSPWLATSVSDFWAKRWHQIFRDVFVFGGRPFLLLVGHVGMVIGAFTVSAILHYLSLLGMNRGSEFFTVGGYFFAQALGVIIEHMWKRYTGNRVGGVYGRVWTYCWVVIWGNLIMDAYCRKGLHGSIFHQDRFRPSYLTLGPLPLLY